MTGERWSKEGEEFVFLGPQPECKDCRLKGPCLHLTLGQRYRITRRRDVHHDNICKLHEDGVRVVEVAPVPYETSVRTPRAIEGSLVPYEFLPCGNLACRHYRLCHPAGLSDGTKVKLLRVEEAMECPVGYNIRRVRAELAP